MFVPPSWFEGMLIHIGIYFLIPLIIAIIIGVIIKKVNNNREKGIIFGVAGFVILIVVMIPLGGYIWYAGWEVPSVQEKTITVSTFEPVPGLETNDYGVMVISNADQILIIDNEGNGYFNKENFLFGKFNTRDILNKLKINGTYKIKYYGWREGFNSGFPNILSIEQVIDESNATKPNYGDLFGTKVSMF